MGLRRDVIRVRRESHRSLENYDHAMPIFEGNGVTVEIWLTSNSREDLEKIPNVITGKADLLYMSWSGQEELVAPRLVGPSQSCSIKLSRRGHRTAGAVLSTAHPNDTPTVKAQF